MGRRKGKSILGMVAREFLVELPKVGIQQILGTTPKRKKKHQSQQPIIRVYKEIHNHRHYHNYKDFNKK